MGRGIGVQEWGAEGDEGFGRLGVTEDGGCGADGAGVVRVETVV